MAGFLQAGRRGVRGTRGFSLPLPSICVLGRVVAWGMGRRTQVGKQANDSGIAPEETTHKDCYSCDDPYNHQVSEQRDGGTGPPIGRRRTAVVPVVRMHVFPKSLIPAPRAGRRY